MVCISPDWEHVCFNCLPFTFCWQQQVQNLTAVPCCPCLPLLLQRPRVLTPSLSAAAAARGLSLLVLDPNSTPQQWREAGVDVLVHKVPDEPGVCGVVVCVPLAAELRTYPSVTACHTHSAALNTVTWCTGYHIVSL